jgi:addiction module HigA family antidote
LTDVARRLKVSRPALYAVLNGDSAVTAEMALRFAKLAGAAPELYLHMQANHDLWQASQRLRADLARIETVAGPATGDAPSPAKRR